MKILEMLRAKLAELNEKRSAAVAEMDAIVEVAQTETRSALTADEEVAFAAAEEIVRGIDTDIEATEARIGELEKIAERSARAAAGSGHRRPIVPGVADVVTVEDTRGMSPMQIADAVTRSLEARGADLTAVRPLLQRHRDDLAWTRQLLARSTEVYTSAWMKLMSGRSEQLSNEERAAIAVGTSTQGGYLVPTHLDPTLIITNVGSSNAIRAISRVVTLTRENTWNGVTTAGVTMSWDAELAEVSDDSPSFANPQIPTYEAHGFVQTSRQAFDDIAGLASDVLMLFADARDRLEGAAHATGSGSGQPTGIFTAITGSQLVVSTTAATIGLVDLQATKRAVPVRWRNRSTWVSAPVYADAVFSLGSAVGASYSGTLIDGNANQWLSRPVVETDDAPTTQTTTTKDAEIILGDFSNYLIVDKPGSTSIEFIPHLFNTANNLPDGRSGWFMRFRSGADSVNDAAFRLLVDKTSA